MTDTTRMSIADAPRNKEGLLKLTRSLRLRLMWMVPKAYRSTTDEETFVTADNDKQCDVLLAHLRAFDAQQKSNLSCSPVGVPITQIEAPEHPEPWSGVAQPVYAQPLYASPMPPVPAPPAAKQKLPQPQPTTVGDPTNMGARAAAPASEVAKELLARMKNLEAIIDDVRLIVSSIARVQRDLGVVLLEVAGATTRMTEPQLAAIVKARHSENELEAFIEASAGKE
jgi:hypothetical protein